MNYSSHGLKRALSSEYVLGTLKGKARVRFQRLMMEDKNIHNEVWWWEKQINQLGVSLPKQKVDKKVWVNIQKRLGFVKERKPQPKYFGLFNPGYIVAAVMVFSMLALLTWQNLNLIDSASQRVAIVQSTKYESLWLIEDRKEGLFVKASEKIQQYTDKDYELWMIAKDGRAPISLGLLPKTGELVLSKQELFDQLEITALAVSLEPLGGSITGSPTTVLYSTELIAL